MNTYICKNCKKPQYSASGEKANEPCIYCGASVELMEDRTERDDTAAKLNAFALEVHQNAVDHGWWETEREFGTIIALCHSELSEALEEHRSGKPTFYYVVEMDDGNGGTYPAIRTDIISNDDFKGEKPEGVAVELADCIIRILDYCGHAGIDIEEAITVKHEYNKTRPYRHGGKKC